MQQQMASLINLSSILIILPLLFLALVIIGFILFSPMGTPVFKSLAAWALKNKNYPLAARLFSRLYHWHEIVGGEVYARQAGAAWEQAGDLREALFFYQKGEDWPKVGQLLMETGRPEQAIEVFREHKLPARLAFCYEQMDNFLGAGELYELELDNHHKALRFYDKALQQEHLSALDRIRVRLLMARTSFRLGKKEESLGHFEFADAMLAKPDAPESDEHLKVVYRTVQLLLQGK
jgi:tetratricopeptide (TPR) repeat protein